MQKCKLIPATLYLEMLTFHNVIILIKSVFKYKNNYYYNIFLENGLYKLSKNNDK